jgi:hypothetical protein
MNSADRNNYWLTYERRRSSVENRWKSKIRTALNTQVRSFVSYLKEKGPFDAKHNIDHIISFHPVGVIIKALYIQAGKFEANAVYSQLRRNNLKFSGFGYNEQWTQAIIQYFQTHLLSKSVLPITETTKKVIRKILERAAAEGLGVEETVKLILKETEEINRLRANVIVRTESVRAMNLGSLLGANQSTIVLDKVWITARDERVRSSHRRLDNVKLDMMDVYPNGCSFPGDPNGSARKRLTVDVRLPL